MAAMILIAAMGRSYGSMCDVTINTEHHRIITR